MTKEQTVAVRLKEGKKCNQIAHETGLTPVAVHHHIKAIRRAERSLHRSSF